MGVYVVVQFTPTDRPGGRGKGKFGLLDYCKLIGDEDERLAWEESETAPAAETTDAG